MGIVELALIGVGLSMDAFAASVCKGLSMKKVDVRYGLVLAVFFGGFQALMPLLGWLLGSRFQQYITSIDHWIAFALLLVLGVKMIIDAVREEDEAVCQSDRMEMNLKEIVMLAVATSIDALAVGISLSVMQANILTSAGAIGAVTFTISLFGCGVGRKCGEFLKEKAEIFGGVILIAIGIKVFLEHMLG